MISLRGTCAELARLFSILVPCVSKSSEFDELVFLKRIPFRF